MSRQPLLPVDEILASPAGAPLASAVELGRSREGRPLIGFRFGRGPLHLSLIAGCHADEPVGPELLRRLAARLAELPADSPPLQHLSVWMVPDANPDAAERNAAWSRKKVTVTNSRGEEDEGFDLSAYLDGVVREEPGDDVEFGFPRGPDDVEARPENRAIADFLGDGAPYHLHASLHGMAFAPGPWFLLEAGWSDRTGELRRSLRRTVDAMGYIPFDVDRGGEKGFHRIDEGFTTRPDSRSMAEHFRAQGDEATAALFRPSSMELVRRWGGDPLTLVSEMPLFLLEDESRLPELTGTRARRSFHAWLRERVSPGAAGAETLAQLGLRPMPISDQMRLQLAFLEAGLETVRAG